MRKYYIIDVLLGCVMFFCVVSCAESYGDYEMSHAEDIMEEYPDSAYGILSVIDKEKISGKSEKARYALLQSMALDKNYIDKTSFEVLQPAIDYYKRNGSPDEKLKTFYYEGRIYENKGDLEKAFESFAKAIDTAGMCRDSLCLARAFLAQGMLFENFYDFDQATSDYLRAAEVYGFLDRKNLQFDCLLNALNGSILARDRAKTDSIYRICESFETHDGDVNDKWLIYRLSYLSKYGTTQEIRNSIDKIEEESGSDANAMLELALAYHRIDEDEKAKTILDKLDNEGQRYDTLRYQAIKVSVMKGLDDYKGAFLAYMNFGYRHDSISMQRYDRKSRSMEEKHALELMVQKEEMKKTRAVWTCIAAVIFLVLMAFVFVYIVKDQKNKKRAAEQKEQLQIMENMRLQSDQEKLALINKNLELEKENKTLEAQILIQQNIKLQKEKDERAQEAALLTERNMTLLSENERNAIATANLVKQNEALLNERDKQMKETENLARRISELENESEGLKKLLDSPKELPEEVQKCIRVRLEMLNELMARHITGNDNYGQPYESWVKELTEDQQSFMESNRLAFKVSHPHFVNYLEQHGLTDEEINYACLYGLGLRSKEVGYYIKKGGHVNTSSAIRKKLGLDRHSTNLGIYLRKLMKGEYGKTI